MLMLVLVVEFAVVDLEARVIYTLASLADVAKKLDINVYMYSKHMSVIIA